MSHATVNVDQAQAWDGGEGEHWAANADRFDAAAARHHAILLDATDLGPGEQVVDIGCGCGLAARDAARAVGTGSVLGIDLSSQMLRRARECAAQEGLENVEFVQADAQVYPFEPGASDIVISRFGCMFFEDPVAAFTNIAGALRPSGRLVMMAWRPLPENEWLMTIRGALAAGRDLPQPPVGAPGPFGLADGDRTKEILTTAGFGEVSVSPLEIPMRMGDDADDAFDFVSGTGPARGVLEDLDDVTKEAALAKLRAALADHQTPEGVMLNSAAWLITAARL